MCDAMRYLSYNPAEFAFKLTKYGSFLVTCVNN